MATEDFKLYVEVLPERINDLCNRYIANPLVRGSEINEEEFEQLSCIELIQLRYNAMRFAESGNSEIDSTKVQELLDSFLECIQMKITGEEFYVIYTTLTHLPYLIQHQYMMFYTQKEKAEEVAAFFRGKCQREGVTFEARAVKPGDYSLFALASTNGLDEFLIDGGKEAFKVSDFYTLPEKYGMTVPQLSKDLAVIAQIAGLYGDKALLQKTSAEITEFLRVSKLLLPVEVQPKAEASDAETADVEEKVSYDVQELMKSGTSFRVPVLERNDGTMWQPMFTNQLALNDYFKKENQSVITSETLISIYQTFLKSKSQIHGVILNPGTSQIVFSREMIEHMIADGQQ